MGNAIKIRVTTARMSAIVMLFMAVACNASPLGNSVSSKPQTEKIQVAFINPGAAGNAYWDSYLDYMKIASKSLGMDVQVKYSDDNRLLAVTLAKELLSQTPRPDYLMYIYQFRKSAEILALTEAKKVRSFIVNTGVLHSEDENVGKPRGKFEYWIGHFHPDNVAAGERLLNGLVEKAKAKGLIGQDGRVPVLAFSGSRDSTASLDYNQGLKNALESHPKVDLKQRVFTNWKYKTACRQAEGLLLRYPETKILWSIGEEVTLGLLCGVEKVNRKAGQDIVVGGTVSSKQGVQAIQEGKIIANMGGDTWEGAHSLVMLYDYHHGFDFSQKDFTVRYLTELVTEENVEPYVELISNEKWRYIDYKKLSRVHQPDHQPVKFNVHNLLNAVVLSPEKK